VIRLVDKDKKLPKQSVAPPEPEPEGTSHIGEFFRRLQPEMRRPKPAPDAVAAALEAAQRLAAEADAEQAAEEVTRGTAGGSSGAACSVCGHNNRVGNRFCAMCGVALGAASAEAGFAPEEGLPQSAGTPLTPTPLPEPEPGAHPLTNRPVAQETHHYHHHYHHHYLPGGYEGTVPRTGYDSGRHESAREDRMRPNAALRGDMSRAEAAVRRITHEWMLACNTRHLDDLLDLYVADALVLRSNCPPVRGAAAVREFFFGALDAGLGEAELEPLRVEVAGDLAYEAGRCKALVPGAAGKRREERGKYLWVCARQGNGEWKLAADCWSSDLTFTTLESDVPSGAGVKTREPRKSS
jgi:ketosteroid isomerase-like protein